MCHGAPLAFYVNYLYNNIAKRRVISTMYKRENTETIQKLAKITKWQS